MANASPHPVQKMEGEVKKIFLTGSAGFIGFHVAKLLLDEGYIVHGYDSMNAYYDVALKEARAKMLCDYASYSHTKADLEDQDQISQIVTELQPDVIIHLAAQAGVRYSIENPRAYVNSNLVGTFNVMEAARAAEVAHLLMASTSSVYGNNDQLPFNENEKADSQLTLYAATKKANENMAHAYSNIYNLPITMLRFFTVYGPWGRPDLALFKFVKAIISGETIDVYNEGKMYRDFTYVSDVAEAIHRLMLLAPDDVSDQICDTEIKNNSIVPFRVVNIGNSEKILLMDFIAEIEAALGKKAVKRMLPMQLGDVPATLADTSLLKRLTGFEPNTDYQSGIREFVEWYVDYYEK